jgi:hypothetical protein
MFGKDFDSDSGKVPATFTDGLRKVLELRRGCGLTRVRRLCLGRCWRAEPLYFER